MVICDRWFHAVFMPQSSDGKRKILAKSKKSKRYNQKNVMLELSISRYFWPNPQPSLAFCNLLLNIATHIFMR